jgi:glycosyltransferase involved in cell wall biosynthesis
MKKPRIFFIIGSLEIGGAEKQLIALIQELCRLRYDCYVFTLHTGGPLTDDIRMLNVPLFSGQLKKRDIIKAPWKLLSAQWELFQIVKTIKPDVIHSFLPLVTFMGALTGRWAKVPLVISSRRALGTHQERYPILKILDRLTNRLSDYVTVNSKSVYTDIIKRDHIDPRKLVLIYNGIDHHGFDAQIHGENTLRQTLGFHPSDKLIIMIGNLIPYKGHSDFLQAIPIIKTQIPNAVFLLVGEDRGIGAQLKKITQALKIASCVHFMGRRTDIAALLAISALLVLPSHEEGFSNVILESMAAGLPVVATDVGGNAEAILNGETGWIVPPKDPPRMAEKIIDLLNDPERARRWGEKGRERVKTFFSIEKMLQKYLDLYTLTDQTRRKNNNLELY